MTYCRDSNLILFRFRLPIRILTIGVLFLAATVRITVFLFYKGELTSDYLGYWRMASAMYNGTGDGLSTAFLSAGYPILLAFIFIFTGESLYSAYLTNIALGTATVWLIIATSRLIYGNDTLPLISGLLWAVYLESIVYTTYLAKENLTVLLIVLIVYASVSILQGSKTSWYCGVAGLACGAVTVAGTSGLALLPLVFLAIYLCQQHVREKTIGTLVFVTCLVLVVSPWLYRNYLIFGEPIVNTNGGFNLYIGNNPRANGFFMSIADTEIGPNWQELRKTLGELGADRYLGAEAIRYMLSHPVDALELGVKKVFMFWTPPYHNGESDGANLGEIVIRRLWLVQWCLMVLSAVLVVARPAAWKNKSLLIVVAGILLYTGIHGIFYVIFRYRLPAMALVTIVAASGVGMLHPRLGKVTGSGDA